MNLRAYMLVALVSVFVSSDALATTYYVSTTGSDGANGTSTGTPWQTLGKVNGFAFNAGDTVLFKRGGTWDSGSNPGSLQISRSGTSLSRITFDAYDTGANPIIKNSTGDKFSSSVSISSDYVTIKNFKFMDAGYAGINIQSTGDNNIVTDIEATNVGIGVFVSGSSNLVTKSYVHDTKMITNTPEPDDDYGANCFWIGGDNNEISYNTGVNCKAPSIDYGTDGGFVEIYNFGSGSLIHHNWSDNTDGFLEMSGTANNVTVYYNVLINTDGSICLHGGGAGMTNLRFENNTVYDQTSGGYRQFFCETTLSELKIKNNIFFSNLQIANSAPAVHTNNRYYMVNMVNGSGVGFSLGTAETTGNPSFVNASTNDFHLQAGSPAIDAGANLGYTLDFDGNTVPQNSLPDLGAYEFEAVAPPPPLITIDDGVLGTGTNQVNYAVGTWNHCINCGGYGEYLESSSWDNVTNDYLTVAFTGTQIKFYGVRASHHGIMAASIDNGAETNVDLYAPTRQGNVLLYTSPVQAYGNHSLKLRMTGTKNAASSNYYVGIDRFDLINSPCGQ